MKNGARIAATIFLCGVVVFATAEASKAAGALSESRAVNISVWNKTGASLCVNSVKVVISRDYFEVTGDGPSSLFSGGGEEVVEIFNGNRCINNNAITQFADEVEAPAKNSCYVARIEYKMVEGYLTLPGGETGAVVVDREQHADSCNRNLLFKIFNE